MLTNSKNLHKDFCAEKIGPTCVQSRRGAAHVCPNREGGILDFLRQSRNVLFNLCVAGG